MPSVSFPAYKAKKSKDYPQFLVVTCGYDDCFGTKAGRPFLVHGPTWLRPQRLERTSATGRKITIVGRACPYCFRTGRLPRRSEVG